MSLHYQAARKAKHPSKIHIQLAQWNSQFRILISPEDEACAGYLRGSTSGNLFLWAFLGSRAALNSSSESLWVTISRRWRIYRKNHEQLPHSRTIRSPWRDWTPQHPVGRHWAKSMALHVGAIYINRIFQVEVWGVLDQSAESEARVSNVRPISRHVTNNRRSWYPSLFSPLSVALTSQENPLRLPRTHPSPLWCLHVTFTGNSC